VLSPAERWHLRIRLLSVPWHSVMAQFDMSPGTLLDVGCGPGLLSFLLEEGGYQGSYSGIDPDARKTGRAERWLGQSDRRNFTTADVGVTHGSFDQVSLLDVLYLVPSERRASFISACAARLSEGGRLTVLTSGGGPGWKRALDRLQEKAATGLGITHGEACAPCDGAEVARYMEGCGLRGIEVDDIGAGYLHGFELVTGSA